MKKYNLIFFLVISLSCSVINAQDHRKRFKKTTKIANKLIRKKVVPGFAVTVIYNDSLVYSKGFGYQNLKEKIGVKPDKTIFRIGSISKPITALTLLKLIEKGEINLDESVNKYLPYFPKKKYDISIRQLGTHTAGIRSYKGNEFLSNEQLTIKEGIEIFKNDSLLFKPGNDYMYTSYGWNLLGLSLQEAIKKDLEEIISENVLEPLKLVNTIADKNQTNNDLAKFYIRKRKRKFTIAQEVDNYYKLPSGGYLSTTEDIALFGNQLLQKYYNKSQIFQEFVTSEKVENTDTYYGIGFQVSQDHEGRKFFGHTGNAVGSYGIFYVYPEENVVCVILANSSSPMKEKSFSDLISSIFLEIKSN